MDMDTHEQVPDGTSNPAPVKRKYKHLESSSIVSASTPYLTLEESGCISGTENSTSFRNTGNVTNTLRINSSGFKSMLRSDTSSRCVTPKSCGISSNNHLQAGENNHFENNVANSVEVNPASRSESRSKTNSDYVTPIVNQRRNFSSEQSASLPNNESGDFRNNTVNCKKVNSGRSSILTPSSNSKHATPHLNTDINALRGPGSVFVQPGKGKGPFRRETPCFSTRTPLVLATARQTGSSISATCNIDSIVQLRNPSALRSGTSSSEYLKRKTPNLTTSSSSGYRGQCTSSSGLCYRGQSSSGGSVAGSSSMSAVSNSIEDDSISSSDVQQIQARGDSSASLDIPQVYMGVVWQAGKLGVAHYDLDTTQMCVMLDIQESEDFTLLTRVLNELKPVQVVVSSKQDERMMKILRNYAGYGDAAAGPQDGVLQCLPSIDFSVEICKRRVLSVNLPSIPDHYTDTERSLFLSSIVPLENISMVRAMGGLLKYLEKKRIGIELEAAGTRLPIVDISVTSLPSQMILDDVTYSALQIFQREAHPSVYKTGTSNSGKEGLSLFGIMNRTKSAIGSRMLRTWFQRPLKDLKMIAARHDAIDYFNNPRNLEVVQGLEQSAKHVKNISKILTRMMQSEASVGDWQALYQTVYNATNIKEVCRAQSQGIDIFKKISETFSNDLHKISTYINNIIDFQESSLQGRFVVKPNVDASLDRKKMIFNGLPGFMTKIASKEMEDLGEDVTECSVLYMPQIGYLLAISRSAVKIESEEEELQIEGLEFLFSSNNVMHYRSTRTRELDSLLGDIRCDITDQETTLMHRLQNNILEHSSKLLAVLDLTAELDCLLTLAQCAREYGYVRPKMTDDNVIEVEAGRHPIQELCCNTFVPNNVLSNLEFGKIKVLTGSNACGKSVYLKQVALIVFLAQIGSFVPAESARLGLIDRIFTRVRSLESVSQGLSTFMIDINQMADALKNAGEHSLCIVDEFGKGTDMVDGMSLLCACLTYWLQQEACPHVLVSTHFHSIIHQQLLASSPLIKYLTLETLHNGEELVFLYQLVEGHTSSSYACHVASQAGLPKEIVKRGIEASALIRECKPVDKVDTIGTETQYERCDKIVKKLLELDLDTADVKSFLNNFALPAMEGNL